MKAVILAGGKGTRISEETMFRPKPMIEIGGRPILWHIMKAYSHYGIHEFVICCGFKGHMIKEYFSNLLTHSSDITISTRDQQVIFHHKRVEPWIVTLVDTGEETMTGGRLRRVKPYLDGDEDFCFTYGDGVSDVNISELVAFHRAHQKKATLTAVHPPARFGAIRLNEGEVIAFEEKPQGEGGLINGGFFVLSPVVLDLLDSDSDIWEQGPLLELTRQRQLMAFKHEGFWQPMDTLRDKIRLEELWAKGKAPWKVWNDEP